MRSFRQIGSPIARELAAEALQVRVHDLFRAIPVESVFVGLDVSMRAAGYAVVDGKGTLLESGAVTSKAGSSVLQCGQQFGKLIGELAERHPTTPTTVCLEEFMKQFAVGRFHTRGLFSLAQINGVIAYEVQRLMGVTPTIVMPNRVRAFFDINRSSFLSGDDGVNDDDDDDSSLAVPPPASDRMAIKHSVLELAERMFPDVVWKTGPRGRPHSARFDQADAIVMAVYALSRPVEAGMLRDADALADFMEASMRIAPEPGADPHPDGSPLPADVRTDLIALCDQLLQHDGETVDDADIAVPPRWTGLEPICRRCLGRVVRRYERDVRSAVAIWLKKRGP